MNKNQSFRVIPNPSTRRLGTNSDNLEGILKVLNRRPTLRERTSAFWNECKNNFPLEWRCITASETGDVFGTYASAFIPKLVDLSHAVDSFMIDWFNEIGFAAGIIAGSSYALNHTFRDAKKHSKNPSLVDAALAAGSAETGCILGATSVAYAFGVSFGVSLDQPLELIEYAKDLAIRVSALGPALPIGLVAMGALTFPKKSEAYRFVSEKGALQEVAQVIGSYDLDFEHDKNRIIIHGLNSHIKIKEKKLPKSYRDGFDLKKNSLYIVRSPVARYFPEVRGDLETFARDVFHEAGKPVNSVQNPFAHDHSH